MDTDVVQLRTGARLVTDITQVVLQFCRDRGDELCPVFVPHATASLALIETGSGSESDLYGPPDSRAMIQSDPEPPGDEELLP